MEFASAPVARLATVAPDGSPHVVPIVFALAGDVIYSGVDAKPKRHTRLQRLANIEHEPRVSVLVDHYADDWSLLWWVRADGIARVLRSSDAAVAALRAKYPQYASVALGGPFLEIEIRKWSSWSAL
jgi:PPOX class probable F420-dependent enzyme